MGAYPKDPALRQRRNKASTRSTLHSVATSDRKRAPLLPRGTDWHEMTRRWWREVFASPMAAEYLDADVQALFRLAVVVDDFWRRPKLKTFEAINRAQATFGLTPLDRKRLEWAIEKAEEAGRGKQPPRPHSGDDPRHNLYAV